MSATAKLYLVPHSALSTLEVAASSNPESYREAFGKYGRDIATYSWGGWIIATLLPILHSNYRIDLMKGENEISTRLSNKTGMSHVILTMAEKAAYWERLDPSLFVSKDLQSAFEQFNETKAPEAAEFMQAGIEFLRFGLQCVSPANVVLLVIG